MRLRVAAILFCACTVPSVARAAYNVKILAADQPGVAPVTDANMVNPWGIAINPAGGAFWLSDNATDKVTLFSGDVNGSAFVKTAAPFQTVTVPGGAPTGQVFNGVGTDFVVTNGTTSAGAAFITASETGNITGWNPGVAPNTTFKPAVSVPGAIFKGLAIGSSAGSQFLYATDFAGSGAIRVFDRTYAPVNVAAGRFADPNLPANYVPFGIQNLGGTLYVTYAFKANAADTDETAGAGLGLVDAYDTAGNLLRRVVSPGGALDAPWGLALAPSNFLEFSNDLIVGNFGDGTMHAYDPTTGALLGTLQGANGNVQIDGLWGLAFGNGSTAGTANSLYFTAGPNDEGNGLFGAVAVPEPTTLAALAPAALIATGRRRRTQS